jgi:hypothetical protein
VTTPDRRLHWQISSPLATHWRPATCAEVRCQDFEHGWRINAIALSAKQEADIRAAGLHWTVNLDFVPGETWWFFDAGQPCFRAHRGGPLTDKHHRLPVGRPELFVVRDGGQVRPYDRADQWADDCATHTMKIVEKIKEG